MLVQFGVLARRLLNGDYMSAGTVKPDFSAPLFTFIHSFVRPEEPILSSRPWVSAERGAQDLSRTAQ